jgi:hypothetical protein
MHQPCTSGDGSRGSQYAIRAVHSLSMIVVASLSGICRLCSLAAVGMLTTCSITAAGFAGCRVGCTTLRAAPDQRIWSARQRRYGGEWLLPFLSVHSGSLWHAEDLHTHRCGLCRCRGGSTPRFWCRHNGKLAQQACHGGWSATHMFSVPSGSLLYCLRPAASQP